MVFSHGFSTELAEEHKYSLATFSTKYCHLQTRSCIAQSVGTSPLLKLCGIKEDFFSLFFGHATHPLMSHAGRPKGIYMPFMFAIIHPAEMPPQRSAAEDDWGRFDSTCHGSFMSKRELWHFFPNLSSWQKLRPHSQECISTHTSGWSAQLNVTLIKTFVPAAAPNSACSAMNLTFVEVSRGVDSWHIMQNKETNKTLFALKMCCRDSIWLLRLYWP